MVPYTVKNPKRQWRSGVFTVNFQPYLTPCCTVSIVNFEHVIAAWEGTCQFYFILPVIFVLLNPFEKLLCFVKL